MTANPAPKNPSAAASTQDVRGSGLSVASGSASQRFFREDGVSGGGAKCERCGEMWVDHFCPNSLCSKPDNQSCEHRFSYDDHADLWRCPCGATALTHPDEKLHQEAVDEADYADQGENNHW